jgi:glycosyltransferase involved in cell wall biosynthesis
MPPSIGNFEDAPIVSIGLPVFNSEKTIAQAIQTILDQSIENWELIISDNNSNDNTVKIIEDFINLDKRIVLYKQKENIGIIRNFEFVLKKSKAKYFHWLAADDSRSINFLNENISFLEIHSDYVASCSLKFFDTINSDQKSNTNFSLEQSSIKARIDCLLENIWQSHSIYYSVIRTNIIKKCQFLGEHFLANDWIIDLYIAHHGKIALQSKSYIVIGINGISRTNPYKPFRVKWIEIFVPLYTFHKKFNILVNSYSFRYKCALQLKITLLHFYVIRRRLIDYFVVLIKNYLRLD